MSQTRVVNEMTIQDDALPVKAYIFSTKFQSDSNASDTRLSFLPPVPVFDDNEDHEEDFSAILKQMEMLDAEISRELEK
jgi:hypothetical protein